MLNRQFAPPVAETLQTLIADVQSRGRDSGGAPVAVFDADGTLWDTDASEDLLDWIDERRLIEPPAGSAGLRAHSDALCTENRHVGYAWAATAYGGVPVETVAEWAEACFIDRIERTVLPSMRTLIETLHAASWDVFIVSASPRWAVLPGARRLGIAEERVLALDVHVDDGRHTDRLKGNVTSGPGKPERIRQAIGRTPHLAAGNTVDDVPMLELAEAVSLVVNPATVLDDQQSLEALASSRGWLIHRTR